MQLRQALGPSRFNSHFECFPPDLLHTLHGGVVRYACVWTLEIVKVRIASYPGTVSAASCVHTHSMYWVRC